MSTWTRDDFARLNIHPFSGPTDVLDEVVAWLNAHHPKPQQPMVAARPVSPEERGELWARIRDELRGVYPSTTDHDHRKLDLAASASADTAVEYLNDRGGLGIDTREPLERALRERDEARRALVAKEDEAVRECHAAYRERDAAVFRAEAAEADLVKLEFDVQGLRYECDEVYAALGAARGGEARTAPAVTKADIENAVRGQWGGCFDGLTDAVWSLVSGADPAVHVVRESELPNLHPRYVRNFNLAKGQTKFRDATRDEVAQAVDDVARDLRYVIAAHRAIEAEDAADHAVEAKAQELVEIVCGDGPTTDDVWDACRRIARHQLGQEASSDE